MKRASERASERERERGETDYIWGVERENESAGRDAVSREMLSVERVEDEE
jgi:hypothetical protein